MGVVAGIMVGDPRDPGMHIGAAEVFGADLLPGRRLDQRRAGEKDGALAADHDGLVGHGRHIGAARRARPHDHGDLADALRRHHRLIVEDAAEMLAVGKHPVLFGKIGAAGIDQINAGQMVLGRDLLGPQMLLHGERIIGAALDRGVVGQDDAFAALNAADAGDQPGGGRRIAIDLIGGELAELEERRARIDQGGDALAGQHLAAPLVAFARRLAAAGLDHRHLVAQIGDQRRHGFCVGRILEAACIER